jgi:hypothetical protein
LGIILTLNFVVFVTFVVNFFFFAPLAVFVVKSLLRLPLCRAVLSAVKFLSSLREFAVVFGQN